ncbi:MAG: TRAP transporter large permease subunit [Cytophagales bacterium]|nr:TRAP transporter large permease subunit [Cytophagales bacterium]
MDYTGIFILVISFIILLSMGVPIAFSIGISGIFTMLVTIDSLPAFTTFAQRMATGLDSFALLAIPFFILAGNLMNSGGIAHRLIDLAKILVGGLTGGLVYVNVIANMLFGAISGSAAAAASAIGSIMGPEMKKEKYEDNFSAAVNISSATTGLSIPPSNVLIVYSLASGGASITALFLAGYIPGILTGLGIMITAMSILILKRDGMVGLLKVLSVLMIIGAMIVAFVYALIYAHGHLPGEINKVIWIVLIVSFLAFVVYKTIKNKDKAKVGFKKFVDAIPSLMLLVIVIGGILAGFFTATEASAVAVLYALVLAMLYKEVKWKDLPEILLNSVKTTGIVMLLVATCMGLSWIMAYENIPQNVSAGLLNISDNPFVILLIINLILLFVGVFMDMTPAVLIFTPIFLPIVQTQLGLSPIHFGIIMVLNLSVGLCTPPVGSVLFIGCSVSKVRIETVIKPLLPMFLAMIAVLMMVTYIPKLSLWLPQFFGF